MSQNLPRPTSELEELADYYEHHDFSEDIARSESVAPEPMITVSLRLPHAVVDRLRDEARFRGIRYTQLIRSVLTDYADTPPRVGPGHTPQPRSGVFGSGESDLQRTLRLASERVRKSLEKELDSLAIKVTQQISKAVKEVPNDSAPQLQDKGQAKHRTKPKKQEIHVVPSDKGWRIVRTGQAAALATARTQAEAARKARQIARKQKAEYVLHGRDGQIRKKVSYAGRPETAERKPS